MESSAARGNSPEKWDKLLAELDDKLQLGLLNPLRRIASYHFEGQTLHLEPGTADDQKYLEKESVRQQLAVFASTVGATSVVLQKKS